jgi:hypothetical protein
MEEKFINKALENKAKEKLLVKYPSSDTAELAVRISQVAKFWESADGSQDDFVSYCVDNYLADDSSRLLAFKSISEKLELLYGNFNQITLGLKRPLDMDCGPVLPIDEVFGGYDVTSHISDDFFSNKIAFYILLNFRSYSLGEKTEQGAAWTREQWALARMGDFFKTRIPSSLSLEQADILTKSDSYISGYNICMGNLVNDKNEKLFPADMKLISHWGLRDELKADYNSEHGLEKQRMIYDVMKHIINQDIPSQVINSGKYLWNPAKNTITEGSKDVTIVNEPDTRYNFLLDNFKILQKMDPFSPFTPNYILRKFESEMEIPQADVDKIFTELFSSPQVVKVASLIEKRLGRKLEPFDIWYDGFKPRSNVDVSALDAQIRKKYPTADAFGADIPNILVKLGFTSEKANYIAAQIQVDASRGAGHAWGTQMKGQKSHLRTRVGANGMDYKGFNIAMHELGHNVEQTLTMNDIDYYMLNGVPNTAFTEALAFVFQKRDLDILGIKDTNPLKDDLFALDLFWSAYEIMGVSLVDQKVWEWMYQHPLATKSEVRESVVAISKEIWNKYYAGVFGVKDQTILGIYSHMIDYPLYLSAYPIGHLIEFQIEQQLQGKNFANEVMRIYGQGRIIPQLWMKGATGREISNQPLFKAVDKALTQSDKFINKK